MVIEVLAEYRVKELLRRHGIKLSQVTARDIKVLANVWLAMHEIELVAQAKEMVGKSPEPQKMYEREERLMLTVLGKLERVKVGSETQASGIAHREAGEALVEIGRSYNVSHSTISRLARRKVYIEGASAASFENSSGE
jgi:hypothetical protein